MERSKSPIELRPTTEASESSPAFEFSPGGVPQSLPPVDGGFGAWSFRFFWAELVVWGFPTVFGIFLAQYLEDPRFKSQEYAYTLLPLIGSLSSGITQCAVPFINPLCENYPSLRRVFLWLGTLVCCASLYAASYARTVLELVALQGVLYALGGAILYTPAIGYMPEWFVARRGLATGVVFAGTSAGGLVLPFIVTPLINTYGTAKTLRIISVVTLVSLVPLLPFIRGRLPASQIRGPQARARDRSWMKRGSFWLLIVANVFQGFAYFVPLEWLPIFANDLQLGSGKSSIALSLLNGASVIGRLAMGFLADRFDAWLLGSITLMATTLATFILWGIFSTTFSGLLTFGIFYGALASGWVSLWTGFVRPIAKDDPALVSALFGYLMFTRGVGNIFSAPIASALSSEHGFDKAHKNFIGYEVAGGRFRQMIIYIGTCFAGAAVTAAVGWVMERPTRGPRALRS